MFDKPPKATPWLEVQIHPSEIRWGVRYFFLTKRGLTTTITVGVTLVLFVLANLFIAPQVIRHLNNRREYRSLVTERSQQGDRLRELTEQLQTLEEHTADLHLIMSRVFLTYGLESDDSIGQGGYPFETEEVSDSIYSASVRQAMTLEASIDEQLAVLGTFIGEVQAFEEAHDDQVRTTPSVSPLHSGDFVLTSPFGTRRSPFTNNLDQHPGLDLAATAGTPIYSPADGIVVFAGRYPIKQSVRWWRYGNLVAVRNGDGFITLFGHCDEVRVRTGQKVKQGENIATVGNTGWSTNPHLHYEVRKKDGEGRFIPLDPRIYILDHRWRDEEQLLVQARRAPDFQNFEPLPRLIGR